MDILKSKDNYEYYENHTLDINRFSMQVKIEIKIVLLSIDFHNQLPSGLVNIWQPLYPSQMSVKAEGEWLRNVVQTTRKLKLCLL